VPNTSFDTEAYWNPDPFATCEEFCHHDLARTVLMSDLLGPIDGPHSGHPLIHLPWGAALGRVSHRTED